MTRPIYNRVNISRVDNTSPQCYSVLTDFLGQMECCIPLDSESKVTLLFDYLLPIEKVNRKVQGMPQSQTATNPRHQEEEKKDKNIHALNKQTNKA